MANKFTKSVLERQAKEYKQHPAQAARPEAGEGEAPARPAPEPAVQPAAPVTPPEAAAPAQPASVQPAAPKTRKPAAKAPSVPVDLEAFIVRDEGRTAKNKTFYLDAAVIDALHRAASAQKVTDSKLVNDILKKLLGV